MKRRKFGKQIVALLMAVMMLVPGSIVSLAAIGDQTNGDTGLTGDIDTDDTIKLPIKIYDYDNDGMLFEHSNGQGAVFAPTGDYIHDFTECDYEYGWYSSNH